MMSMLPCRFKKPGEYASGFVGTSTTSEGTVTVLVTNYHVFQTLDDARDVKYQFGYNQKQPNNPDLQLKMIPGTELIPKNAKYNIN